MRYARPLPASTDSPSPTGRAASAVLQLGVLLLAWGLLYRAPLTQLWAHAAPSTLRLNLMLGLGLTVLVWRRARTMRLRPAPRVAPLSVVLTCAVAHVGLTRTLDIDIVSCATMVLGAWGLAGLFMPTARWRQAFVLAIAGVCILPMSEALDLYLGFPLRLATAHMVHAALEPLGLGPSTAETIVLIEGGGVQVDVPCSGIRSLWSGALAWAAMTWIERRRIGLRWLWAGLGFAALLVVLNGVRVLALSLLHGLAPPLAMRVLHVPLGLLTFTIAGALGWLLLRRLPVDSPGDDSSSDASSHDDRRAVPANTASRPLWGLGAGVLLLALLPVATPPAPLAVATIELADPSFEPIALRSDETRLFESRRAEAAGKWQFMLPATAEHPAAQGQLVMVQGRSFRSQHRPDICHAAAGRSVDTEHPVLLEPEFPVRELRLRDGDAEAVGIYWFQSAEQTTNEYGARIWSSLGDRTPWVMVSVMVEPPRPLDDPALHELLRQLHAHTRTRLHDLPHPSTKAHP